MSMLCRDIYLMNLDLRHIHLPKINKYLHLGQAATPKLCMLACMSDGGARDKMHEFGYFLCMLSGSMTMLDDPELLGQRDRSRALVESAISDRWYCAGLRHELVRCVRSSCSDGVYGGN
jgi:hypothetical protein